ncbi:cytochrome P450 [Nocardia yamanashiensis]|uniref:cytochrome P450 n=1 Tax=Nocardia yamanashiensis TaxID=209247 RepID=UPI001E3224D6|nr:cytochrome P450 [Nocardia yamanashiensis]UGT38803.1 cytochrome P450 [Nocardia yamanashiensis]
MSSTSCHAARFEPRSGETWRDPWPMYSALREHDPVHHVVPEGRESDDYYVLSRHADVYAAARDPQTFSSASGLTLDYVGMDAIGGGVLRPFVFMDPPEHTDFRRRVSPGFTPRQVNSVEPAVRRFVIERVEKLKAAGGGDIVAELFKPLPTMVVAHYLGVPEADRAKFDEWTFAIVGGAISSGDISKASGDVMAVIGEMAGYFTQLIDRRRTEPGDDTISHMLASGIGADGDTDGLLAMLGFAFTMITGGNDTTTGNLGGAVQLLSANPEQRRLLVEDPSRITVAVEEFLRMTSPVQGLARTATRDVELHDTVIPAGRRVLLLYASANHDEREYGPTAEQLDVLRNPKQIMTFSHGHHHCLGAAAARMQARVALEELLARCPEFTVDIPDVVWSNGNYVRWPMSVPFHVTA